MELELRPQLPHVAPQLSATSGPNRSLRVIPEDPRHQASAVHSKCPGQAPVNRGPAGATGVEGPSIIIIIIIINDIIYYIPVI